eukprot:TRINITY_DN56460_c0_g1_i1.p2 TRINITY_DN56460_c0_g1~~TRINITY_DN56460_c0_g1_i1.p2  ORF type:complete len:179 (-),score=17.77 TRINITY_DN56460_c0_g1_i1:77-613(-)
MLALAVSAHVLPEKYLQLAEDTMRGCYVAFYMNSPSGLAPEKIEWLEYDFLQVDGCGGDFQNHSIIYRKNDQHSLLRPETMESLFFLYRSTGKDIYREWGWNIFNSFRVHSKVVGAGYAAVQSVVDVPVTPLNHLDTFWMSETLKYAYLLFSDRDVLPLDEWIFNTEGHPMRVLGSTE